MFEEFLSKRVLVTGGTGMIGRQVVHILRQAGAILVTVSLDREGIPGVHHICANLRESKFTFLTGMDYVFHLAGLKGSPRATSGNPVNYLLPMLEMDIQTLRACAEHNVKRVVYSSSIGAYQASLQPLQELRLWDGSPMDIFPGTAKRTAEVLAYAYSQEGHEMRVVRLANVYGPWDNFVSEAAMVVPTLLGKAVKGDFVVQGDGQEVRDFIYSRDAAEGIVLMMSDSHKEQMLNIGSGRGYSIQELAETIREVTGRNFILEAFRKGGYPFRVLDTTCAERIGFRAKTSLRDGIRETWEWLRRPDEH